MSFSVGQASQEKRPGFLPTTDIVSAIKGGQTEGWLHKGQKGLIKGREVWAYLQAHPGVLSTCIKQEELRQIEAEGGDFYRRHFSGKAIFAWGSGVHDDGVPYILEFGGRLVHDRFWLEFDWRDNFVALRRT